MTAQAIDWAQFWQQMTPALIGVAAALLGFISVVLGGAALTIRAAVKNTWDKEKFFLEMQKQNNDELKALRADQRESDRREIDLHNEINQVRMDSDRKLGEAMAENGRKMAEMKADYESQIADLKTIIGDLEKQLEEKERELQQERQARKAAEAERDEKIDQFEKKIAALEQQVDAQKTDTAELKAAQEKPRE